MRQKQIAAIKASPYGNWLENMICIWAVKTTDPFALSSDLSVWSDTVMMPKLRREIALKYGPPIEPQDRTS